MDNKEHSILALAFIGDAYYNLFVKKEIIAKQVKVNDMQKDAALYCSARFQAQAIKNLLEQNVLTEQEVDLFKRGRNAKSHGAPKNTDILTYKASTGFEAIWGYHYLNNNLDRLAQIWCYIKTYQE